MKFLWKPLVIVGTIVLAGPAAASQPTVDDPSVANAAVPRTVYRSVFRATPRGLDSPLVDWKKANADVGQFRRGHVDILKWEAERSGLKDAAHGAPATPGGHHHHHGAKP